MAAENPALAVAQIDDQYIRKNFDNLKTYFSTQNQFLNFNFFEIVFTSAITHAKQTHGCSTVPTDIILSCITGSGSVTFNRGLFDATNLDLTVTGPCRIRFYVGSYFNQIPLVSPQLTDTQTFSASGSGGSTTISTVNGSKYNRIVGSASQVSSGLATDSTIVGAIAAASSGNNILILAGTFTETVVCAKQLVIEGSGYSSRLNGSWTFSTGASYSSLSSIRVGGNITINSAVVGLMCGPNLWFDSTYTFVDNSGTTIANILFGIQG